jgi:hypothetical protein
MREMPKHLNLMLPAVEDYFKNRANSRWRIGRVRWSTPTASCFVFYVHREDAAVEGTAFDTRDEPGAKVRLATVTVPVANILRGERTALDALSRYSGVSTASRRAADLASARG